jgi:hypothetical protein
MILKNGCAPIYERHDFTSLNTRVLNMPEVRHSGIRDYGVSPSLDRASRFMDDIDHVTRGFPKASNSLKDFDFVSRNSDYQQWQRERTNIAQHTKYFSIVPKKTIVLDPDIFKPKLPNPIIIEPIINYKPRSYIEEYSLGQSKPKKTPTNTFSEEVIEAILRKHKITP